MNIGVIVSKVFYFEDPSDIRKIFFLNTLQPQLVFGQIWVPDYQSVLNYKANQCKRVRRQLSEVSILYLL